MNDEEFFTLINRAYRRAGKEWDYLHSVWLSGALGCCDLDEEMAWVDRSLEPRVRNHVLLHELAHLVGEETDDYNVDELIVERATRVVLSLKDYLSLQENMEFIDRIAWYSDKVDVDTHCKKYGRMLNRLIDELLRLLKEEDRG